MECRGTQRLPQSESRSRSRFTTNGLHQPATAFRLLRNASKTRDTQRASPDSAFISTPNGHLSLGDYCAHEMRHEFITLSRGIIWHTNQRPTSSTSTAGEPPASCPNHSSKDFLLQYNYNKRYTKYSLILDGDTVTLLHQSLYNNDTPPPPRPTIHSNNNQLIDEGVNNRHERVRL